MNRRSFDQIMRSICSLFAEIKKPADSKPSICVAFVFILILPVMGSLLLYWGATLRASVAFSIKEHMETDISIFTDSNSTVINELEISLVKWINVDPNEAPIGVAFRLVSDCSQMFLCFGIPRRINFYTVCNDTQYDYFHHTFEYNETMDMSFFSIFYISSTIENEFRIVFDWDNLEKIAYDKECIAISFYNPLVGKPLYSEPIPFSSMYFPQIDETIIRIKSDLTLDPSLILNHLSSIMALKRQQSTGIFLVIERSALSKQFSKTLPCLP